MEDPYTHPVFNVEETIGKTVGKRKPASNPLSMRIHHKRAGGSRHVLPVLGVPRGVYRFKTHEEADEWMIKMLAKTAAEKS